MVLLNKRASNLFYSLLSFFLIFQKKVDWINFWIDIIIYI